MGYYEFKIMVSEESKDALTQRAFEIGALGLVENADNIIVYFPDVLGIENIKKQLNGFKAVLKESGLNGSLSYDYVFISERDWNESWKKKFKPINVGDAITILPPWENEKVGRINLIIDPGMAFGTGHHETTKTCLILIERLSSSSPSPPHVKGGENFEESIPLPSYGSSDCGLRSFDSLDKRQRTRFTDLTDLTDNAHGSQNILRRLSGAKRKTGFPKKSLTFWGPGRVVGVKDIRKNSFLDFGTGTGILAIAALKLGFKHATCIDIDPLAIDAVQRNAKLNGLENIEIIQGSISKVRGTFDFIAANLLSGILIQNSRAIASHLNKPGIVLISGIITGQEDDVIDAMQKEGLQVVEKYYDGRWVTVILTH